MKEVYPEKQALKNSQEVFYNLVEEGEIILKNKGSTLKERCFCN